MTGGHNIVRLILERNIENAMIKNIILDMGNVLLDYNPEICLNYFLENEEDRGLIRRELFEGSEWREGDLGYITDEERFLGVSKRVPERLHKELKQCATQWHMCMQPVPGAKEFCEKARGKGFRLYVLSNASNSFYAYFPRFAPVDYFDGIVVSCDIHLVKPDIRIYKYLLNKYNLKPEECIFIDDMEYNVQGARDAGMRGEVFQGDYEKIKEYIFQD